MAVDIEREPSSTDARDRKVSLFVLCLIVLRSAGVAEEQAAARSLSAGLKDA